jgi:hypothetical protein
VTRPSRSDATPQHKTQLSALAAIAADGFLCSLALI